MKSAYGLTVPGNLREMCAPIVRRSWFMTMQAAIVPQIADGQSIVRGVSNWSRPLARVDIAFSLPDTLLPNASAGVGQFRRAMVWQRKDDPMDTRPLFTARAPHPE